jgi:hypothetical protein
MTNVSVSVVTLPIALELVTRHIRDRPDTAASTPSVRVRAGPVPKVVIVPLETAQTKVLVTPG